MTPSFKVVHRNMLKEVECDSQKLERVFHTQTNSLVKPAHTGKAEALKKLPGLPAPVECKLLQSTAV